jgi:hypothetical protein
MFFALSVGVIGAGYGFVIWVAVLLWEAFFRCMEYCPIVFDVDNLEGTQPTYV